MNSVQVEAGFMGELWSSSLARAWALWDEGLAMQYDVVGIGNAIVDVVSHEEEAFIAANDLAKGAMTLISEERAQELYKKMGSCIEVSGGSAGNTMAGIASLGGKGAYIGKVRNDQLGEVFAHDIRAIGVDFTSKPLSDGPSTARCLVVVTPDAQRTMSTFLGACVSLSPDDIDENLISNAKVTYLEGYLWDRPSAKEAFLKAAKVAHDAGQKVSLTLSDSFCVDRHRDSFAELVEHHVDVLFANEDEIKSLYQCDTFEAAAAQVKGHCETVVLTRSEKGSTILRGSEVAEVAAHPVEKVLDTTGAGDLYAAGFLYGYTRGLALGECGRIASVCAAEIISHYGARPEASLRELAGLK
jgi:sugar/nucleoside kinase (ribokinase family)